MGQKAPLFKHFQIISWNIYQELSLCRNKGWSFLIIFGEDKSNGIKHRRSSSESKMVI